MATISTKCTSDAAAGCHGDRKTASDISTSRKRNGNAKKRSALAGTLAKSGAYWGVGLPATVLNIDGADERMRREWNPAPAPACEYGRHENPCGSTVRESHASRGRRRRDDGRLLRQQRSDRRQHEANRAAQRQAIIGKPHDHPRADQQEQHIELIERGGDPSRRHGGQRRQDEEHTGQRSRSARQPGAAQHPYERKCNERVVQHTDEV
jgi:hypothetical protein